MCKLLSASSCKVAAFAGVLLPLLLSLLLLILLLSLLVLTMLRTTLSSSQALVASDRSSPGCCRFLARPLRRSKSIHRRLTSYGGTETPCTSATHRAWTYYEPPARSTPGSSSLRSMILRHRFGPQKPCIATTRISGSSREHAIADTRMP